MKPLTIDQIESIHLAFRYIPSEEILAVAGAIGMFKIEVSENGTVYAISSTGQRQSFSSHSLAVLMAGHPDKKSVLLILHALKIVLPCHDCNLESIYGAILVLENLLGEENHVS